METKGSNVHVLLHPPSRFCDSILKLSCVCSHPCALTLTHSSLRPQASLAPQSLLAPQPSVYALMNRSMIGPCLALSWSSIQALINRPLPQVYNHWPLSSNVSPPRPFSYALLLIPAFLFLPLNHISKQPPLSFVSSWYMSLASPHLTSLLLFYFPFLSLISPIAPSPLEKKKGERKRRKYKILQRNASLIFPVSER